MSLSPLGEDFVGISWGVECSFQYFISSRVTVLATSKLSQNCIHSKCIHRRDETKSEVGALHSMHVRSRLFKDHGEFTINITRCPFLWSMFGKSVKTFRSRYYGTRDWGVVSGGIPCLSCIGRSK